MGAHCSVINIDLHIPYTYVGILISFIKIEVPDSLFKMPNHAFIGQLVTALVKF